MRCIGVTFDLVTGTSRKWYAGADGVQRWAHNDTPVACLPHIPKPDGLESRDVWAADLTVDEAVTLIAGDGVLKGNLCIDALNQQVLDNEDANPASRMRYSR